jgi:hypothetical protein
MNIKEMNIANVEVASHTSKRNRGSLGRLARVCAIVTAVAVLPAHRVMADPDDENQQILPFPTVAESAIPTNGDVNPYGVTFVPNGFPAGGLLNPGDLLVSNFNNNQNSQGTGTTIIKVAPNGQTSLFFQGTAPLGLSTGLATGSIRIRISPAKSSNSPRTVDSSASSRSIQTKVEHSDSTSCR